MVELDLDPVEVDQKVVDGRLTLGLVLEDEERHASGCSREHERGVVGVVFESSANQLAGVAERGVQVDIAKLASIVHKPIRDKNLGVGGGSPYRR